MEVLMNTFAIGSYIVSFDYFAVVRDYHRDATGRETGLLIVENPRIGRWLADPAKCTAYVPPCED